MSSGTDDPHDFGKGHPSDLLPDSYGDELDDESSESRPRKKIFIFLLCGVAFIALIIGAYALGAHLNKKSLGSITNTTGASGSVQSFGIMTEQELRTVISSNKLIAYWTGPLAGYKYSIYTPKPGVVVVKYLPAGNGLNDTAPNYRVIGTYMQPDAMTAVETAGKKEGSVGFVNVDGNAVFYVRTRPTNVYVAIKGKEVQVEIFDPIADQSLALALFKGQLQQIK